MRLLDLWKRCVLGGTFFALVGLLIPGCQPETAEEGGNPTDPENPGQAVVEKHTTTYIWGKKNTWYRKTDGLLQICASLDSVGVDTVRLLSDGLSWEGVKVSAIRSFCLEGFFDSLETRNIPQEQVSKIHFAGDLKDAYVDIISDSVWISTCFPDLNFIDAMRDRYTKP